MGPFFQLVQAVPVPDAVRMTEREVWEMAGNIVAQFGNDHDDLFVGRFVDLLQDTAAPEDWRRVAAAVDAITDAPKQ